MGDGGRRELDPAAPAVVVGAGILGCSAAYHLLRSGARNVTVIDKNPPGQGTTSAGAGFVAPWAAGTMPLGETGLGLERYSLGFYRDLHQAGHDIAYRGNGNLILALSPEAWHRVGLRVARHPAAPAGTRVLTPQEVSQATGVVDPSAVHAAAFMPPAIQIEPSQVIGVLTALIEDMGGRILTGVTAEGFSVSADKVTAVASSRGDLEAAAVILAAGAWTNLLTQQLGFRLPLLRVIATRVITGPLGVPSTMPTIQCDDFGLWIREHSGGLTWGSSSAYRSAYRLERSSGPILPGQPRSRALLDIQLAEQRRVEKIIPRIAGARPERWVQGMPAFTPDTHLYAGPAPIHRNVIVLGGDNESGIAHGPGMGRVAAELVHGLPTFVDIRPCRLDRFDLAAYPDEQHLERMLFPM